MSAGVTVREKRRGCLARGVSVSSQSVRQDKSRMVFACTAHV